MLYLILNLYITSIKIYSSFPLSRNYSYIKTNFSYNNTLDKMSLFYGVGYSDLHTLYRFLTFIL